MAAKPDPFLTHVADQVLAALAEAGKMLSTPEIQEATGYGLRYGQLTYRVLARLAAAGDVEKVAGVKPVYWRRTRPQAALPPFTVRKHQGRGRPS